LSRAAGNDDDNDVHDEAAAKAAEEGSKIRNFGKG
jgi:hypothetical protein